MRIFELTIKDLTQILRDKRSLLFLLAMPIIFTIFMGFAYKGGGDTEIDKQLVLGWENQDKDGLLSEQFFSLLSDMDSVRLVELSPGEAENLVRQGKGAGALIVPADFSIKTKSGELAQLTLITDTNTSAGQSLYQILRAPLTQLMSSAEIAQLSSEMTAEPDEYEISFRSAAQTWEKTSSVSLVRIEMAVAEPQETWYGDNPYNQASPGIIVQFAIFGLVTSGQILVSERKTRTLQRMMSTSMRAWQIIAGHTLAMFAIVFGQILLLVVFGQLALGVNYAQAPLAVLLVSIALGLWVAVMGLLIGVLAKDDSQVVLYSLLAMFIFSALGGTWFPLEASSGAFAAIGKLIPSAWAMNGYQNILIRGLGISSVWTAVLVLLAYAAAFFMLAVWRFRKMEI